MDRISHPSSSNKEAQVMHMQTYPFWSFFEIGMSLLGVMTQKIQILCLEIGMII